MKISLYGLKYVTLKSICPHCKEETESDWGSPQLSHLKSEVIFFCEEHGEFKESIDWGQELNKAIKEENEKAF